MKAKNAENVLQAHDNINSDWIILKEMMTMSYGPNNDNVYKEGTTITAKVDPDLKLIIVKYWHRIYYCAVVGEPDRKQFAYFERELNPAAELV